MLGHKEEYIKNRLSEDDDEIFLADEPIYKSKSGPSYKNMITRKGLYKFLTRHMNWSEDETTEALDEIFGERAAPLPSKKRERPVDEAALRDFLKEIDSRIGHNAMWSYMQSKKFQQEVQEAIQKEVDRLRPSLIQKMREELQAKIEAEIEEEAEDLKRQSRSKASKSIFVYDRTTTKRFDDEELLNGIKF